MKIEKQVCSIDLSDELRKLGVIQESLYYHVNSKHGILPKEKVNFSKYASSAFTCAELVQMMENSDINYSMRKEKYYSGHASDNNLEYYKSFADGLASKLLDGLRKKWLSIDVVNERLVS